MRSRLYLLLAALLLVAAVIPMTGCGGNEANEPYKVGAIFATTGFNAPLGEPEKQTVDMMVEQINANGGINGHPIEVIAYNNESVAANCATLADKLINDDKVVAIIGPTGTGDSNAIVDTCDNAEIPLISCAAGISIITPTATNDKHWIFSTPQTTVMVVQRLYAYLNTQTISKIGIITDTAGFGADGKANLVAQASAYGLTITSAQTYGTDDPGMETQLGIIRDSGAEAVICWGTNPGPAIVARNMATLPMTIPLFCSHGIAFQSFIDLALSAANGVIFPAGKLPIADNLTDADPQKALLLKYRDDFNAKYGNGKANTFGGHAYDALSMVVKALENAVQESPKTINSNDDTLKAVRAKIRDYIENSINSTGFPETGGFPGTAGIFNMSADNHNGLSMDCLVMVQIVDKKWTRLQ
ncbi:MAG: ABC transporter substrate-binding protein [Chloroflexi bacterium]|nr:ABC transporter substrate-binding protein [Chloroflexota bacterium]